MENNEGEISEDLGIIIGNYEEEQWQELKDKLTKRNEQIPTTIKQLNAEVFLNQKIMKLAEEELKGILKL